MKFGIPFNFELCTVTALGREKLGSCDPQWHHCLVCNNIKKITMSCTYLPVYLLLDT